MLKCYVYEGISDIYRTYKVIGCIHESYKHIDFIGCGQRQPSGLLLPVVRLRCLMGSGLLRKGYPEGDSRSRRGQESPTSTRLKSSQVGAGNSDRLNFSGIHHD